MKYRTERDSLGKREIPVDKYYGIQTKRAVENFRITGVKMQDRPKLVKALAAVKEAAAKANLELGLLEPKKADVIIQAAKEIFAGKYLDQFPVDMIQGGAGTSANMNINEVICNRALEIMGKKKGEYRYLHPNNHVNLSQSTNDVYPTATKITVIWRSVELIESIETLRDAFSVKGAEFKDVIKIGRTQLQDAVPMTLGQEFDAFAASVGEDIDRLKGVIGLFHEINIGATAIGTGINTLPGYVDIACRHLSEITGLQLSVAPDLVEATSDAGVYVSFSSVLKRMAVKLNKICNDLRLLASGPRAGFHDINLPAVQPGSSIMPGKVNPVIPEVVNQVCFQIIAYDTAVCFAVSNGQLQLNAFEPIIIHDLLESLTLLKRACLTLREKCIVGITSNTSRCKQDVLDSPGLLTAFSPYIGYEEAAKIAKKVQSSDITVYQAIKESGLLEDKDIETILSPESMTAPHARYDIISKVRAKQEND